jgi:phospholipase/carboxylesterase
MLLTRPEVLSGAVLMRATLPFSPEQTPSLAGIPVLMLSGAADPMVLPERRDQLAKLLRAAGADLTDQVLPAGHGLTAQDISLASSWLAQRA